MKKTLFISLALCLALVACKQEKPDVEAEASAMLTEARALLEKGNVSAARDSIMALRTRYPLAKETRSQAVLTLDSVELAAAVLEGDSLKIEFCTRKIEEDKANIASFKQKIQDNKQD